MSLKCRLSLPAVANIVYTSLGIPTVTLAVVWLPTRKKSCGNISETVQDYYKPLIRKLSLKIDRDNFYQCCNDGGMLADAPRTAHSSCIVSRSEGNFIWPGNRYNLWRRQHSPWQSRSKILSPGWGVGIYIDAADWHHRLFKYFSSFLFGFYAVSLYLDADEIEQMPTSISV